MNIMLYSITHETSNYDLELVKKLFTILTDQVISSTVFPHSCVQFFFVLRKKGAIHSLLAIRKKKRFNTLASTLRSRSCVYLLYTGYHFFLSALLTSWQESAELLWLCFWYPAASSPLLSDSNIIKYIFRLCKAHQIQIKRFVFFKATNFLKWKIISLEALCQILKSAHQRLLINKEMNNWGPFSLVRHRFPSCNFYLNLKQFPSVKSERNCRKSAHLFQRSPSALLSW